jgi:hypothetical protein
VATRTERKEIEATAHTTELPVCRGFKVPQDRLGLKAHQDIRESWGSKVFGVLWETQVIRLEVCLVFPVIRAIWEIKGNPERIQTRLDRTRRPPGTTCRDRLDREECLVIKADGDLKDTLEKEASR